MSLHHTSLQHDQRNESASDLHARDVAVPGCAAPAGMLQVSAALFASVRIGFTQFVVWHLWVLHSTALSRLRGSPASPRHNCPAPCHQPERRLWKQRKREIKVVEESAGAPGK